MLAPFDPVLVEVIKNELASVNEEMAIAVFRTGRSGMMKIGDFATAVADAEGRIIAEGAAPFQIGIFEEVLAQIRAKFGDNLKEGDLILVNDPYMGMGHLPDVAVAAPVFWEQTLAAFTIAYSHHTDIGGRFPGGFTSLCNSIFEEGLRIPAVKLYQSGERNEAVFDLIAANVRTPEEWIGDVEAKAAGCHRGEQELHTILRRYGVEAYKSSCEFFVNSAEQATREAICKIAPGEYSQEDLFEDDEESSQPPLPLKVTLRVCHDNMTVDFTGTAPQVANAINMPFGMTKGTVYGVLKSIVGPSVLTNIGFARPIEILAPKGTLVNPTFPAAVGGRAPLFFRVIDLLFRALGKAMPGSVGIPGEGGDVLHFNGDTSNDRPFSFMDVVFGGWGARPTMDGIDGVAPMTMGSYGAMPSEVLEREYPIVVEGFGFVADTGGPGKYRGSLGIYKSWRFLQNGHVMVRTNRLSRPSEGLAGGRPGALSCNILTSPKGSLSLPKRAHLHLEVKAGDRLYHVVAGAGGYGDPSERTLETVALDVKEEKVTPEQAQELYGLDLVRPQLRAAIHKTVPTAG